MNARHTAIIETNADRLVGCRVLDIASHDGRWSFAALQAGAAHVVGIEPREELVDNARETFSLYGTEPERFQFLCGSVFDLLRSEESRFDVVLCLGFFYHTIRHAELLDLMERTGATLVVIDTEVTPAVDQLPVLPIEDPRIVSTSGRPRPGPNSANRSIACVTRAYVAGGSVDIQARTSFTTRMSH